MLSFAFAAASARAGSVSRRCRASNEKLKSCGLKSMWPKAYLNNLVVSNREMDSVLSRGGMTLDVWTCRVVVIGCGEMRTNVGGTVLALVRNF